jgi:hypothetical protein
MASLEKRGNCFRIVFRHRGTKYSRSLETSDSKAAGFALARVEDTLHRVELGTLTVPAGADFVDFLLADGRLVTTEKANGEVVVEKPAVVTLANLFTSYFDNLPEGNLEENTIKTMKLHQALLEKHFGKAFLIDGLSLTDLQGYVEKRSRDKGRHDRKVTPTTIKKAIVTLRTVWNWGRQHGIKEHPGGLHTFTAGKHVFRSKKDRTECLPLTIHEAHHYFRNTLQGTKWEKLHGWHVFRHSFCSNCAAKGIDQRIINAWVGHLSDDMVRRYRHLLPDQNHAAIAVVFG